MAPLDELRAIDFCFVFRHNSSGVITQFFLETALVSHVTKAGVGEGRQMGRWDGKRMRRRKGRDMLWGESTI